MTTLLLSNAVVHGSPNADCVVIEGDRIAFVGYADHAPVCNRAVDCGGGWLAPAFVDAHLHTVQTGFLLTGLDLRTATSVEEALSALAEHAIARPDAEVLIGTGWDESAWPDRRVPTATELDDAAPGRQVILTRLDGHSAVLSPALMTRIEGLSDQHGYDPAGHMTLAAMQLTSAAMGSLVGPDQRLTAARAAVAALADQGIAAFHDAGAPHIGPAYEIDLVRQAAREVGLLAFCYWGEHAATGIDLARQAAVAGLAGDLNIDGSIGSRTAALRDPYADRPGHSGHAYLTAEEAADHLVRCTRAGIQGGFHCIGEAGLDALTEALLLAVKEVGVDAIRASCHRVEHVEMPSPAAVEALADLGLVASMQPQFDRLWGGPDQMYAERLGDRWQDMNPIGALHRAGVTVAFGSDGPVTRPLPWDTLRAAVSHHDERQRVSMATAFAMHTAGGWRAVRDDTTGEIVVGAAAHLALWEADLRDGLPDLAGPDPRLRRLIVAGQTVREKEETP